MSDPAVPHDDRADRPTTARAAADRTAAPANDARALAAAADTRDADTPLPLPVPTAASVGVGVKLPLAILATIVTLAAIDYAQSLVMPIVLALILSLTLSPLNLKLQKRLPGGLAALILVGAAALALMAAAATLSQPVTAWIENAPRLGAELKLRLRDLREPMETAARAGQELEDLTSSDDPTVSQVSVREPDLLNRAASTVSNMLSTIALTIALSYFLLTTNRLFLERLVKASPRLSDKKRSLATVNHVISVVSNYLLTITLINAGFGITIGVVMMLLGMPSPVLWALSAFLLNFLPFVGSFGGTVAAGVVGLLTYPEPYLALIPALAYFTITTLEGHFLTPALLGRRLELNPVMIVVSIALWGFLWGVVGVILAVPILIVVKVVCDNVESLTPVGLVLAGATDPPEPPPQEPDGKTDETAGGTA